MKKFFATFLCLVLCGGLLPAQAAGPEVNAKAVLLMEKTTGQVLYEEHAHDPLELASVTKVMTMLLIMEALEEGTITKETMVPVSATAAGMGGSQVYMKEGESFSVHDMLKAIAVASGNDACVAMAEYLAGSESAFVEKMNARAAELGMENTVFVNCPGLPAEGSLQRPSQTPNQHQGDQRGAQPLQPQQGGGQRNRHRHRHQRLLQANFADKQIAQPLFPRIAMTIHQQHRHPATNGAGRRQGCEDAEYHQNAKQ